LLYEKEKAIINEQHIQDLLYTKLEIQQQTMQDISREIHDNIGQRLTLASIYANQLSFENQYPMANERISAIGSIINESLSELRSLSRNLKNGNEEIAELEDLVQNECNRVNALNICTVECRFSESNSKISTTIKNFILRIIQEFLQNSLKHANCKNVVLNFDYKDTGLFIHVKDDGIGFDMNTYDETKSEGIGLSNMKKRAELIGADFSLKSALHKGTDLNLFIPISKLNI
jgi:signal transduction histidine kinase